MAAAIIDRFVDPDVLIAGGVLLFIEGRVTLISDKASMPLLKYGSARAMMAGDYSETFDGFLEANGGAAEFLPLLDGHSTTGAAAKVHAGDA